MSIRFLECEWTKKDFYDFIKLFGIIIINMLLGGLVFSIIFLLVKIA